MNNAKIFIVGSNGQLGKALQTLYPNAQSADIDELDISDRESVASFNWSRYDSVINAAAFTNVDGAETSEGRIAAWDVNAAAVRNLVEAAEHHGFTLVHISTDYVFDGTNPNHPEDEALSPLSVYGQSKAAGDLIVQCIKKFYIVRTSWVIGEGKNFVRTMLELGAKGINPSVVSDQVGRLTFTSELVRAIDYLLVNHVPFGIYNVTNSGDSVSWAEVTRQIFTEAKYDSTVTYVTTAEYYKDKEGIAPRPLLSTLDLKKIQSVGFEPTDWRNDLRKYIQEQQ